MRLEIQLLRSFAVLSVIFFHFEKEIFPNGYLGVDVFFVISGFLIFNKIREQIEENSFELKNFYYRRFKRIFPSLLTSAIFTLVIGFRNLSLEHLYELIRGLKYSFFFIGNIYFSQMFNYFSIETDRNLIVNLWSLAVEEQFYIVFPVFVILIYKFKKPYSKLFIFLAFLISLLANTTYFYNAFSLTKIYFSFDNYVFYSPFTRGWQLLLGALIPYKTKDIKYQKHISKILILFLVGFLFTNFKFYNQLFATFITAALLILRPNFSEILPTKFFKHIGDISYSLYLFHQPVLAATRNHYFYKGDQIEGFFTKNLNLGLLLIIFIYLISIINYKFVEKKYLKYLKIPTISKIFLISISSILLIVFFNPTKFTSSSLRSSISVESLSTEIKYKPGTNYLLSNVDGQLCTNRDSLENTCKFGSGNNKLYFLGDSIISSLVGGFLQDEIIKKYTIIEFTRTDCYPIYGVCDFGKSTAYDQGIERISNSVVVLGGIDYLNIEKNEFSITIQKLFSQNNKIIFIGYIPFPETDETMYFLKNKEYKNTGNKEFYERKLYEYENFSKLLINLEIANVDLNNFIYIDIFSIICPNDVCNYILNDESLFIDGYHFSYYGAKFIVENSLINKILVEY